MLMEKDRTISEMVNFHVKFPDVNRARFVNDLQYKYHSFTGFACRFLIVSSYVYLLLDEFSALHNTEKKSVLFLAKHDKFCMFLLSFSLIMAMML